MPACFGIRRALEGIPCGLLKVQLRSSEVAPMVEVHGKLGGNRGRTISIGAFQTAPDLLVKTRAALRGDVRIHHLLEEVGAKAIACRQRPVRPRHRSVGNEELPLTRPGRTTRLDPLFRQGCGSGYGGKGECLSRYACRLENRLLLAG